MSAHAQPTVAAKGKRYVLGDNIMTRGIPSPCGSRLLEGYEPPYDAAVVERLAACGAQSVGKVPVAEFGHGTSPAPAEAVASGRADFALAVDGNGGTIEPAVAQGLLALRSTRGTVSRHGMAQLTSSFDSIVPIAANIDDLVAAWEAISGHDARDACSIATKSLPWHPAPDALRTMTIGAPPQAFALAAPLGKALGMEAVSLLGEEGLFELAHAAHRVLSAAEAGSNLARFDGIRLGCLTPHEDLTEQTIATRSEGFGEDIKRLLLLGAHVVSEGNYERLFAKAQHARENIRQLCDQWLTLCDVLVLPLSAQEIPALCGLPALSMPYGGEGFQLMAAAHGEHTLLTTGQKLLSQEERCRR